MKKIIMTFLVGILFSLTSCSAVKTEEEREKLQDYLVSNEQFTCIVDEQYDLCEWSLPLGVGVPNKELVIISKSINYQGSVVIKEHRLHNLDDLKLYVNTNYNLENGDITAELMVRQVVDGEATETVKLTGEYENHKFKNIETTLTNELVTEIKQLTLDDFESVKEEWDHYFDEADVKMDDLY